MYLFASTCEVGSVFDEGGFNSVCLRRNLTELWERMASHFMLGTNLPVRCASRTSETRRTEFRFGNDVAAGCFSEISQG